MNKKVFYLFNLLFLSFFFLVNTSCSFLSNNEKKKEQPKKTLESIYVNTDNIKKEYFVNELLDLSGLKVFASYDDKSNEEIFDYSLSITDGSSLKKAGEMTIVISYNGKSTEFKITIIEIELLGITLNTADVKKEYFLSEKLDLTNLTVIAKFNNGSSIEVTDFLTSIEDGSSFTESGLLEISVSYKGYTSYFNINIIDITLTSIEIKSLPTKKEYFISEKLDLTGLEIFALYNDGSKDTIYDFNTSMTTGDIFPEVGNISINITYQSKSISFQVLVKEDYATFCLNIENVKLEYFQNETLDLTGLVPYLIYNNGVIESPVSFSSNIEDGSILQNIGTQKIIINHDFFTSSFEIVVKKNYLNSISLTEVVYSDKENLIQEVENNFIAKEGFILYEWWIDGNPLESSNSNVFSPTLHQLRGGYHELMLLVCDESGRIYSASATFLLIE